MIASGVLLLEGTDVGDEAVDWLGKVRSLSLCQGWGERPKQRTTIATIGMKLMVDQSVTPGLLHSSGKVGMYSYEHRLYVQYK